MAKKQKHKKHKFQHKPDKTKLYRRRVTSLDLNSQEFRATLLRPDEKNSLTNVDGMVESVTWRYESGDPVMQGDVQFRRPRGQVFQVHDGHVLRLEVRWGDQWEEIFRMRLYDGQQTLTGGMQFTLSDDGRLIQESKDDWHFTKTKKGGKPKGWLCHEIVIEVARRYRIPLGKIAEGKHYITGLNMKGASPMQVIQQAYSIERKHSSRRFVIRWVDGKLNILPLQRNKILNILGPQIQDATIARSPRDASFATAVTVRATVKGKSKHKKHKIVITHVDEKAVKRDGFIHLPLDGGDMHSTEDALHKAKRYLNKHAIRKRTITGLQHRGIAFIRRGDAMRISLPQFGFHSKWGVAFVTSGSWTISGGSFQMSLDFGFDDPFEPEKTRRKKKDKKTRKDKRDKKHKGG